MQSISVYVGRLDVSHTLHLEHTEHTHDLKMPARALSGSRMKQLLMQSAPALRRLAFRIVVVGVFARFWPGRDVLAASTVLCVVFATGCAIAARGGGEPVAIAPLNRWGEAVILIAFAALILLAGVAPRRFGLPGL